MGFKLSFDLADIHLFKPTCIGKTKIRGRVEKSGGVGWGGVGDFGGISMAL